MNRDGKSDKLHFNLEVPVSDSQDVVSVEMILVFDYKLNVSRRVMKRITLYL